MTKARVHFTLLNIGHFLDHLVMLVFATVAALVLITEWNEFRHPDFTRMKSLMRTPVVFDGRNLFTPEQMKQNGFTYYSIGRR